MLCEGKKKLSPKRALFVKHYLGDAGRNATKAAIAAGFSEKTAGAAASRLLKIVEIRDEIERETTKLGKKLDISAEYVLATIKETIERCRQAEPVLDKKGNQVFVEVAADHDESCPEGCEKDHTKIVPAFQFNPIAVLKGAELLGKHFDMFGGKPPDPGDRLNEVVAAIHGDPNEKS
jgi:phage terminase small subunit